MPDYRGGWELGFSGAGARWIVWFGYAFWIRWGWGGDGSGGGIDLLMEVDGLASRPLLWGFSSMMAGGGIEVWECID